MAHASQLTILISCSRQPPAWLTELQNMPSIAFYLRRRARHLRSAQGSAECAGL